MQIKLLAPVKLITQITRNMSIFKQVLNPITGLIQWDSRSDDYDYHQEIATSGYGDMLHDKERNQKYFAALRKSIARLHEEGREAHVLDIGTGTGLLSMMAVAAGADTVTACEAFIPMANCAERILEANGMLDKVKLIKKRSTELSVNEDCSGGDLSRRANVLVAELLDTELIGEGALSIYNHAHEKLLTDDVICIPSRASCYAQVVESPLAAQWNTLKCLPNSDGEILIKPSVNIRECKGGSALHDVQLSQLPSEQIRLLTSPVSIFEFDFSKKQPRELARSSNLSLKSIAAGSTDLVFYWWDIKMDLDGEILLSCAPFWAHPDFEKLSRAKTELTPSSNVLPWRDHWMQAIYYIPKPFHLSAPGAEFILSCNHDEYALWFDAFPPEALPNNSKSVPRHNCSCGFHITYSRNRIGQMNQSRRNKIYMHRLEESIREDSNVLVLGDGCLIGLSAAKLGAASVICHETQNLSYSFMNSLVQFNGLKNVLFVKTLDSIEKSILEKLTHIFAEPYFMTSILPWDNFFFGTLVQHIKSLHHCIASSVEVTPRRASILAVPVEFLDLHKIRIPVENCEGFDLRIFDELVHNSKSLSQAKVEAQPLWEYPCRALGVPREILNVSFCEYLESATTTEGIFSIEYSGICNGIALWVDWQLTDDSNPKTTFSTGPMEPIQPGAFIKWDMFQRQGVHLFDRPKQMLVGQDNIYWCVKFKPDSGEIQFEFNTRSY